MKNTYILMDYQNQPVDPELIVQKINEFGKVIGGKAYGHWSKYPATMFSFSKYGIELIEIPEDGFANRKGNDIKLAVDTIEAMFILHHIENFVLVTGDADFVPLARKLKTYGKSVIVISRSKNTSHDMQLTADIYIPYEEIVKAESLNEIDSFDDLVDEVSKILQEKNLTPDQSLIKRIVNGMDVSFNSFGYTSMNALTEDIMKTFNKKVAKPASAEYVVKPSSAEYLEYVDNYGRFLERLVVTTIPAPTKDELEKLATSKYEWIMKNTNITLKDFIKQMIDNKKLISGSNGLLSVPAPRRWEIRYEKLSPYADVRKNFAYFIYEMFKEKKVETISDAIHMARENREKLNLNSKILGSFGIALKFSGMFIGKDGSDYVSLKTPVQLNGKAEELAKALDTFYVKMVLKDEDLNQNQLDALADFVWGVNDENLALKSLTYLMTKNEVEHVSGFYKYLRRNITEQ